MILFPDLEELLNLLCTQLFPLSPGSYSSKRDIFYIKWQPVASDDEKTSKIPSLLIERAKLQFKTFNLRNSLKLPPFELNK